MNSSYTENSSAPILSKEVAFIDQSIVGYETIIAGLRSGVEVVLIATGQDGLNQIATWASGKGGYSAIHIFSHGNDGQVSLGNTVLTSTELASRSQELATLRAVLGTDGDVLVYACNAGRGESGSELLEAFARTLDADVAGSLNLTGSASAGGDWVLEKSIGTVSTEIALTEKGTQSFAGTLAASSENFDTRPSNLYNVIFHNVGDWTFEMGSTGGVIVSNSGEAANYLNVDDGSGTDKTIWLNTNGDGIGTFLFKSTDGSEFKLDSFKMGVSSLANKSVSITGYRNGAPVTTAETVTLTGSDGAGNISYALSANDGNGTYGNFTFNSSAYGNIDEVRFAFAGVADPFFDDLTVSAVAVANNLPQAGGNVTVTTTGGQAVSVLEDAGAPGAANIRLTPATLSDVEGTPGHIRIISVAGGTLTQSNGTVITLGATGTKLALTSGSVDLRFTPAADRNTAATFEYVVVDSADANSTQSTATVPVTSVADTPSVASPTITEDTDSGAIAITRYASDGAEVTHYKITAITGGKLYSDAGFTTEVTSGSFISSAGATTNVYFRPTTNSNTAGNFTVQASKSASDAGLGGSTVTSTISITPVNDLPSAGGDVTVLGVDGQAVAVLEDAPAPGAANIRLTPTTLSDVESTPTQVRIISVTGGTLTQADGSAITLGATGTKLTLTGGSVDMRFTPSLDRSSNATFQYAVVDGSDANSTASTATVSITPVADTPSVGSPTINKNADSGAIAITRNAADGAEVTHYKITSITGGKLYSDSGYTTEITAGSFIASAGATTNVYFRPDLNSTATGGFTAQASKSNSDAGLGGSTATSTITITAVADTPTVASPVINEDADSGAIAITRNAANGAEVTHYKITGITGGKLYSDAGYTSEITAGSFIASAGTTTNVYFRPEGDWNGTASFTAQASTNNSDAGLGGSTAASTITITPVNDAPTLTAGATVPLTGTNENSTSPSTLVATVLASVVRGDVDASAVAGIAVKSVAGNGTWQYSTNGAAWTAFGSVSDTAALLLGSTSRIRFVGDSQNGGTATYTFHVWDQTSGTASSNGAPQFVDVTVRGGTTAFSTNAAAASMTVTSVNDAPVITMPAGATTWTEGANVASTAVVISPALVVTDVDNGATLASATVQITGNYLNGQDTLAFTSSVETGNLTASFNATTGMLTLTSAGSSATLAEWQAALRAVTFTTSGDAPSTLDRSISFTANDGLASSAVTERTVTITAANDSPTVTAPASIAVTEGIAVHISSITIADPDAGSNAVTVTLAAGAGVLSATAGGGVTVTGSGTGSLVLTGSVADINTFIAANAVNYTTVGDEPTSQTLSLTVNDGGNSGSGGALQGTASVALNVTAINDAPTLTATGTLAAQHAAGDVAGAALFSNVTVSTVETGQNITAITLKVGGLKDGSQETLVVSGQAVVLANLTSVDLGGGSTASVADIGSGNLSVTISKVGGFSAADAKTLLEGLRYKNTSATPTSDSQRTVEIVTIKDSGGVNGGGVDTTTISGITAKATVLAPPPSPAPAPAPTPAPSTTIDGVSVTNGTVTNSDGSTSKTITIPVVQPTRTEAVGNNTVADIPLVQTDSGNSLLTAQVPTGLGLQVSGTGSPKAAGSSAADLIRQIKAHTEAGSADQNKLTGAGAGFLQSLPADAPMMVQTIVPTMASNTTTTPSEPLAIIGTPRAQNSPLTALVIDTRGLPSDTVIQLQHVEFAAVIGAVRVTGGDGFQNVWGDGSAQYIVLGSDDDILHGGGGDDTVGSAGGNDQIFGDEGNDLVFGGEGNDVIDGGTGIDTVRLAGTSRADYVMRIDNGKLSMVHRNAGVDGADTVASVERMHFAGQAADMSARGTISRLYDAMFDRVPDQDGLNYWLKMSAAGLSMHDIANQFVLSEESVKLYGTQTNAQFVDTLYQRALGRAADTGGRAHWIDVLDKGKADRADVMFAFANSEEKLTHEKGNGVTLDFNATDVATLVRMYDSLFNRKADQGGLNHWIQASEGGMSLRDIGWNLVNSTEAQSLLNSMNNRQFVEYLYKTGLERTASEAEVSSWAWQLDNGAIHRGDALLGFADSAEKITLVGVISTSIETI